MTDSIIVTIKGEDVEISKTLIEHVIGINSINRLNDPNLSEAELYKILLRIDMAMYANAISIVYIKGLMARGITQDKDTKANFAASRGDYEMANKILLGRIKEYEKIMKETHSGELEYNEDPNDPFGI